MRPLLDEEMQAHVYSCLLAGGKVWQSMKKNREKLELPTTQEDRELELNAKLRMMFNPKAEEIAREKERKDPRQQDFTDPNFTGSSGETGGGNPPGETFKTKLRLNGEDVEPTDLHLRDALLKHDRLVLLSDIAEWSPGDRMNVILWVTAHQNWMDADVKGPEPEEPECLGIVALSEDRMMELVEAGPYEEVDNFGDEVGQTDEPKSVTVRIPAKDDKPEVVFGEYEDAVDAQIKCARLNQAFQRSGDMSDEDVARWLHTGPWEVDEKTHEGAPAHWYVVEEASAQRERMPDEQTARGTAARYNRTIAGEGVEPTVTATEAAMLDEKWERHDETLLNMLGLVIDVDRLAEKNDRTPKKQIVVLREAIASWDDSDAYLAEKWAGAVHLRASDNDDVDVPATPAVIVALDPSLERPAMPGIKADAEPAEETTQTEEAVNA